MKLDARAIIVQLVAAAVLVLAFHHTMRAIRSAGVWRPQAAASAPQADPYERLDGLLAADSGHPAADRVHNPFVYGPSRAGVAAVAIRRPAVKPPTPPPPPPQPTLTSIVWDNDPRATIRYDGRDVSVRTNDWLADYRVKNISANQVVLERNGQQLVLTLRPKGDEE